MSQHASFPDAEETERRLDSTRRPALACSRVLPHGKVLLATAFGWPTVSRNLYYKRINF